LFKITTSCSDRLFKKSTSCSDRRMSYRFCEHGDEPLASNKKWRVSWVDEKFDGFSKISILVGFSQFVASYVAGCCSFLPAKFEKQLSRDTNQSTVGQDQDAGQRGLAFS
jgi:hypothetical protein